MALQVEGAVAALTVELVGGLLGDTGVGVPCAIAMGLDAGADVDADELAAIPSSEAGLFIAVGPSRSALDYSPPTPRVAPIKLISTWPTAPALSVTSRLVSKPKAASSQRSAAIGSR